MSLVLTLCSLSFFWRSRTFPPVHALADHSRSNLPPSHTPTVENWLAENGTSPLTGEEMPPGELRPNWVIKGLLESM